MPPINANSGKRLLEKQLKWDFDDTDGEEHEGASSEEDIHEIGEEKT